jgi:hypothetical protein
VQRSAPLWTWVALSYLAAAAVLERLPLRPCEAVLARARVLPLERDPRRMSARELRQLPGVGEKLALALACARDGHAGARPLDWEDVPGIGEVRARAIRAWFRSRGIEPDPLAPAEPSGAGVGSGYARGMGALAHATSASVLAWLTGCGGSGSAPAPRAPEPASGEEPAPPRAELARVLALQGGALHALAAGPERGTLVLLLHGARFSARTWEELGTLARLARAGHRALAIDWPGFGATPAWDDAPDAATLIGSVCDELGAERVVLVAPSLGGRFALEFLGRSPARAAGLVAIAPAGSEGFAPERCSTPVLLVWGERDEVVPLERGHALAARLSGARLEVLPGAAHACYLEQPERFHALLLEFLGAVAAPPR